MEESTVVLCIVAHACSRCARCFSRLSRSGHHRSHPKPLSLSPGRSGINANNVLLVVALMYFVSMPAVFMVVSITLKPNMSGLELSCDRKCRASICQVRSTPDLFAGPLADDEFEKISGLSVGVRCSNGIFVKQLVTNQQRIPILKAQSSDSPDDKSNRCLTSWLSLDQALPQICGSTICSCASSHRRRVSHPKVLSAVVRQG